METGKFKPTREQLEQARSKLVPDVIGEALRVLFCGINPGLYTAAIGHHFGRPGNRFWPALHQSGFTPRLLSPFEDGELLCWGLGITNIAPRATASAAELTPGEVIQGGKDLLQKVDLFEPRVLAVLGVQAYRQAFSRPEAKVGLQPVRLGATVVWVLPNPSGLNAHYQMVDFIRLFGELRAWVEVQAQT